MSDGSKPSQPNKPKRKVSRYYPLFKHATGQFAKKVRGKLVYFGTDNEQALKLWFAQMTCWLVARPAAGTPAG